MCVCVCACARMFFFLCVCVCVCCVCVVFVCFKLCLCVCFVSVFVLSFVWNGAWVVPAWHGFAVDVAVMMVYAWCFLQRTCLLLHVARANSRSLWGCKVICTPQQNFPSASTSILLGTSLLFSPSFRVYVFSNGFLAFGAFASCLLLRSFCSYCVGCTSSVVWCYC